MRAGALRILLLTDRDWTHPEAGGTGTTLQALVSRWIERDNRVTVISSAYPGGAMFERPHPRLELHRMGDRLSVFPRAAAAFRAGIGGDADVVFEVINGIAFFTPLWRSLRAPTVVMVQHVHQHHYVMEAGWRGYVGRLLLERLPLRYLYGRSCICTISHASRRDLIALGVPEETIHVTYLGVEPPTLDSQLASLTAGKAERPTILYLGRLKRYKRLEVLLDVLAAHPDAVLEVAGDGTYRAAFEEEVRRRELDARVVMHGFVPDASKPDLFTRAWVNVTASSAEGWGHTVMEAATYGTPTAALRVGGLAESIVDGETGVLADDATELCARVGEILALPTLRDRLGRTAAERAQSFSWNLAADDVFSLLAAATAQAPPDLGRRLARPTLLRRPVRLTPRPDGTADGHPDSAALESGAEPTV